MPVRRIDTQFGTVNPDRPSQSVVEHFAHSTTRKEVPQGANIKLQSSISSARGNRNETKMNFAHRTGITSTLNDTHHPQGAEAAAELLASSSALKGADRCVSSSVRNTLKACGNLTTNRAAYNPHTTMATEEEAERISSSPSSPTRATTSAAQQQERAYSYLRGTSFKPVQYHELPYGRECDYVIGEKMSVYREDFCSSKSMQKTIGEGHAPGSPRLMSVYSPSALLQKVQQQEQLERERKGIPSPPKDSVSVGAGHGISSSPRRVVGKEEGSQRPQTMSSHQQQQGGHGYNVFMGAQLIGSEKAERNVDAQARREIEILRLSTARIEEEGIAKRLMSDTMLTPRTMRLNALQREQEMTLLSSSNSNRLGEGSGSAALPIRGVPLPPQLNSATNSPRRLPLISRAMVDRSLPQPTQASESPRSTAGRQWLASNLGVKGVFGLNSTIPADVAPRTDV